MRAASRPTASRQSQGLAALTVVMTLFFVMALVAAYANRNIVFEQRMSAGSQRAERAMAAADGAVDWAVAMLNSGRINANCQPSTNIADSDFRSRYLSLSTNLSTPGAYSINGGANPGAYAGCKLGGTTLACACPSIGDAFAAIDSGTDNDASFRISFLNPGGVPQSPVGTILLQVRGCSAAGNGEASCYGPADVPNVDAKADVRANIGLIKALPAPPQATLTAGGNIAAGGVTIRAANRDNPTGLVLHAGGTISYDSTSSVLLGPPGSSGSNTASQNDDVLSGLSSNGNFFASLFGMGSNVLQQMPGVVPVTCPVGGCTLTQLNTASWQTTNAGKLIFVNGNLTIDGTGGTPPAAVGSQAFPVMLVVNGNLTIDAGIEFIGFLYANNILWTNAASAASVRGAMIASGNVTANTSMSMTYDAALLEIMRISYGSYVRVPGGWNRGGL